MTLDTRSPLSDRIRPDGDGAFFGLQEVDAPASRGLDLEGSPSRTSTTVRATTRRLHFSPSAGLTIPRSDGLPWIGHRTNAIATEQLTLRRRSLSALRRPGPFPESSIDVLVVRSTSSVDHDGGRRPGAPRARDAVRGRDLARHVRTPNRGELGCRRVRPGRSRCPPASELSMGPLVGPRGVGVDHQTAWTVQDHRS